MKPLISAKPVARGCLLGAVAVMCAFAIVPASAHAILMGSSPAANGQIAGPAVAFSLRYNSRIDKERSKLTLTYPDKTVKPLPIAPDGPEEVLAATADLAPGAYDLRWQVLAIDGHITRGEVPFDVSGN
jgi:methionine-rich copper-binding protein CopC